MASSSQEFGKSFETILVRRAQSNGLLAMKNHLSAFYISGGGAKIVKSELDLTIIARAHKATPAVVGWFDAKTTAGAFMTYSDLLQRKDPQTHQIDRSAMYCELGVPSGFICWLRAIDQVICLPGDMVQQLGPGTRFDLSNGMPLGKLQTFDLRPALGLLSLV